MTEVDEDSPRRQFAEAVKAGRHDYPGGPLSQTALAEKIRCSKTSVSRLETTEDPVPPAIPGLLDQVFSTDGLFKELYKEILAGDFPKLYRRRMVLEPKASFIAEWSPTVVPGLLQTAGYAYRLFREGDQRASEQELARKVEQRIARQVVLESSSPPDLSVVICESVLRRTIGGSEVMREQLEALLVHIARPTTLLQVLPLDAGAHGLMDGSMSILTAPDVGMIAYTEGIKSGSIIDEPSAVQQLRRSYDVLTASALSRDASTRMIRKQLEAL
ncbi:DUF5753 domain-containing protein [Streptomyces sp. NPDC056638]|uniref:DUF5753 domain-containing protein n=1 Tax=Streptomyces sp. NPDC056638 TaxID=3345887 RepID=UPI0036C48A0C